jgi:hypothetical protein
VAYRLRCSRSEPDISPEEWANDFRIIRSCESGERWGWRYIDEIAREWRVIHLSFVIDLRAAGAND